MMDRWIFTIAMFGSLLFLGITGYMGLVIKGLHVAKKWLSGQLKEGKEHINTLQEENGILKKQVATLEVQYQEAEKKLTQRQGQTEQEHQQLLLQFKNLSHQLLEKKSKKFTHLHKTALEELLRPLSDKIALFEQEMTRTHHEAVNHKVALRTELERIHKLNNQMTEEAKNLTQAIKGDFRVQGSWGEFILEGLLESAGLTKGREYFVQQAFTTQEGKRLQPDVIIHLPQDKNVIIDAKITLKDYEQYVHAQDEARREHFFQKHLAALKRHVKGLHEKNYAQAYGLKSLDFVLMFVPIEPAFSLALQKEPSLFERAYHHNVILVAPSTLLATLRTIGHLWKQEYQHRYTEEIAQQSGALYDKFVSFVEELKKIGNQLATTQRTYESALGKLSEGKGNLISRAERIKKLGVPTKKQLNTTSDKTKK